MSDPSGKIAPFLVAALVAGLISGGVDVYSQVSRMHPSSFGQAVRCLNWGEFGISVGAGAVAGLVGFTVFTGGLALMGTGLLANVASGALSGVFAGQYGRLTTSVLAGQSNLIGSSLFHSQDLLLDAGLGGVSGAVGYGLQRGLSGLAQDILQNVTNSQSARLANDPALAQEVLSQAEYSAGQNTTRVAKMQYGNAVERMVARQIEESPLLLYTLKHVGGPNNPDFVGKGIFDGLNLYITTNTSQSITSHQLRPYGPGLLISTYSRPIGFTVFP
jgi:hypothetical protein